MTDKPTAPVKANAPGKLRVKEIKSSFEISRTWGDKVALFITNIFGSMIFLSAILVFFITWIAWNMRLIPGLVPFDPYPFSLLEIIVSVFAVILSVSVLISQNRQRRMEKISQQVEFEVNVRAENEITKVLVILHEIQKKMGMDSSMDPELEEMKKTIDLQQIHHKLEDHDA